MASTVSNGNDRSEKWQRPFQMATTVYEREICVGDTYESDCERNILDRPNRNGPFHLTFNQQEISGNFVRLESVHNSLAFARAESNST